MSRAATPRTVGDQITTLLVGFTLTTAAREMVSRFVQAQQQPALPLLLDVLELEAHERHERRITRLRRASKLPPGKTFATLDEGRLPPALVPGDEFHVRQVVRNLIDNAIKYNRDPGEVTVHLRIDASRKQVLLIVKDTGIGIDQEVLPRIFERFYRADKARSREKERAGYGLGLSICQTVIQALHGEITVESDTGKGTTFTVRLPLIDDATSLSHIGIKQVPLAAGS